MYGILKQMGVSYKPRLFVSFVILLLPNIISQSILTDTDIVLAAYLSSLLYAILRYENSKAIIYLYWAGIAFGLALSHKITFLFSFPPLFLFYSYIFFREKIQSRIYLLKHLIVSHVVAIVFLTLSTGYLSNIFYYGHPIGPKTATTHQSVERAGSLPNLLVQGSRNVLRYSFDILNFDGLRNINWVEDQQKKVKVILQEIDSSFHVGLESVTEFTIVPFSFNRRFENYNGTPIYGAIFILFIIPSIILYFRRPNKVYTIFLAAFILHFLALSFTAAYDPWKGRYMISSAIFIFPLLAYLADWFILSKNDFFRNYYMYISTLLVCISAILTISLNIRALPFDYYGRKSIFHSNRMEVLTASRPDITQAYQNFDSLVPANATVALATINDDYEYPLWGKKFTRHLIPINPFDQGLQKIPQEAQYLFFAKSVIRPQKGDIRLGTDLRQNDLLVKGEDYYLRKLN
jgi:4-amino-4-deoxy-L-arabinose transferase-like glycosyltransferase